MRCAPALSLAALLVGGVAAQASDYPSRPVTLVVPFPPGGSTSILARSIADEMSAALGGKIVVENRGGAGGTTATRAVARAAPDGYTLLLGYTATLSIAPFIYAHPGYDTHKDFVPIGMIGASPSVLVAHPSTPARSVRELVSLARASATPLQYGSPGLGTVNHLAGELFAHEAGVPLQHIPYKGNGPALPDLLGGHIPLMFAPIPVVLGAIKDGQLRPLGVTSAKRSPLLPDVPTFAEQGLPGVEVALRYGLIAPAGTPPEIVAQVNRALNAALAMDSVRRRIAAEGADILPGTPQDYAADLAREDDKYAPLVRKLGLRVE